MSTNSHKPSDHVLSESGQPWTSIFPFGMRRRTPNPLSFSEVLILDLCLQAFDGSSVGNVGRTFQEEQMGCALREPEPTVCKLPTVHEVSVSSRLFTFWDSPGVLGHQGLPPVVISLRPLSQLPGSCFVEWIFELRMGWRGRV